MAKILFIVVSFMCSFTLSAEEAAELPPLDPGYVGVHGMVLFTKSSSIYASHLPLYHKPHNVQLIYKLENKDLALLQSVRDGDLVTIKPKPFNLQRLMRGEKMVINADVYSGHFERDGMLVYESIPLTFAKLMYVRDMVDLTDSSNKQEYDVVNINKNNKLYIHRIQKAPSYDHILHIDVEAGCLGRFNTSSAVPKENELLFKFINCGTMTPLYYENQDFSAL
ncbi:hypothetical protein [Thalassotalea castellviae]|uniref:DUF3108 domain-containing protein n=1 Tax=Thalassotalea castellviae TaxID=3075612 RepID=A0ABU2ZXR5_9GAMM|nr:hypothetical protein [Thalassotalea sp. W431]MDT0602704.1 hypothetical protein [Thalassotalea sp. W431]